MRKRIVSILLISILFLQMLPCAAIAETVLYAYPEVNAYLAADEIEQYEREYRLWASELIRKYRYEYAKLTDEHDLNSAWNALYKEYWNAAKLKTGFISQLGDELKSKLFFNSSAETILTYAETGKTEEYYMYVFLQSLEEAVKVDPDLKEQYESMPKKDRIYMTIDLKTGELKNDIGLYAAETIADEMVAADMKNLVSDITVLAVNVAYYWFNPKALASGIVSQKDLDFVKVAKDILLEAFDAYMENVSQDIADNQKNKLENSVKSNLASDFASHMMSVNEVTLDYVEQAYLTSFDYGDQAVDWGNIEDVARKFVKMSRDEKERFAQLTAEEAKEWTAPSSEEVLKELGIEIEGILTDTQIHILSGVAAVRAAIIESINQVRGWFKKSVEKSIKDAGYTDNEGSLKKVVLEVIDGIFELLVTLVDDAIKEATSAMKEAFKDKEEVTAIMILDEMGRHIAENFGNEALEAFRKTILAIIPEPSSTLSRVTSEKGTFHYMLLDMLAKAAAETVDATLFDILIGGKSVGADDAVKGVGSILKEASNMKDDLETEVKSIEDRVKKAEENTEYWQDEIDYAILEGDVREELSKVVVEDDEDWLLSNEESLQLAQNAEESLKDDLKAEKSKFKIADWASALGEVWGDMMEVSQSLRDTCVSGTLAANNDAAVGLELARMESAYRASLAMEIEATHRTAMYYDDVKFDGSVTYSITYTPEEQKRLGLSSPYYEYTTLDDALKISGFLSPEYILNNPEGTSINDIRKIISMIYMQIKYDIVGANIYDSIVMKENDVAGAAYIKYAQKNHNNIYGSKGLLPYSSAHRIYNSIVDCQSWFGESGAYKEEWDVLFK